MSKWRDWIFEGVILAGCLGAVLIPSSLAAVLFALAWWILRSI